MEGCLADRFSDFVDVGHAHCAKVVLENLSLSECVSPLPQEAHPC